MNFLRSSNTEAEINGVETTVGTMVVELKNGRRYEVNAETWDEDEHYLTFETDEQIVAKFAKDEVLLFCSTEAGEIKLLAA